MKNLFKLFALASIVFAINFTTSSCKKGENDPGISLRSRTARLAGEWTLESASTKSTSTSTDTWTDYDGTTRTSTSSSTGSSSFDGTFLTETNTTTEDGTTTTNTQTSTYTETLTIEKDGTFSMKTVTSKDGDTKTNIMEGNWIWLNGNDDRDLKNKEAVIFTTTKSTYTHVYSDGNTYTSTSTDDGKSMNNLGSVIIDRLANDELIIIIDSKDSYSSTNYTSSDTENGTRTYTQE